jgi:hypothetical protein
MQIKKNAIDHLKKSFGVSSLMSARSSQRRTVPTQAVIRIRGAQYAKRNTCSETNSAGTEIPVSWLDGKECIVLEYSETSLVAQWIRDEIRKIGPDLYLGKVYWSKSHIFDFALQFSDNG